MMSTSKAFNNDISEDKDACLPNFVNLAQDVQNWVFHHIRTATTKEQHYCKFFKVVKV
jgi:hypothetical protein